MGALNAAVRVRVIWAPASLHAVGLVGILLEGCSQAPRERAPYAEQECREDCGPVVGGAGGAPVVPSGGSDTGEQSSRALDDGGVSLTVELDVREATDLERTAGASIGVPFTVYSGSEQDATLASSNGNTAVTVSLEQSSQWLLVVAEDDQGTPAPTWLSTLMWQQASADPVVVPLFSTVIWSGWAAGLALAPSSLDPEKGHVLLRVTDPSGNPRAGISARASSGAIAYGVGGTASDVLPETDASGLVVWFNAPTGDGTALTLASADDEWSVTLPTKKGAVSVVATAR